MNIFSETDKSDFLKALKNLDRLFPRPDMEDDRDFISALLYRMAKIVCEHGPSHGVNLSPYAWFIYSGGGRSGGKLYEASLGAALREAEDRKRAVSDFKLDEGDIKKVIYNPPAT